MCIVMGNLGKTAVITTAFCLTLPLYAAQFAGGTGEPDNPYQIATAEQLGSIGLDPNLQDKHFVLTADIDLDPDLPGGKLFDRAVIAPDADPATDGYQGTAFSGVFDGDGHTISNLTIQGADCLGLFGRNSGIVRNVALVNADVTGSGNAIGVLAGSNLGSVAWCCSTGAVVGSSIIGGLVGHNDNGICSYWQMSTGEYPRLCCYDPDIPVMLEGSGTAEEPYLIRDANDLGAVWLKPAAHYRLETPIDLSPITWSVAVVPWFDGIFDGNGYVISNLRIEGVGTLGLFGESNAAASILNLGLEAVEIDGTGICIGGLAGINRGSIAGSYSTGTLVGDWYIGGLIGDNEGSITTSYSESAVSADAYTAGGLVGRNSGRITSCHSAGEVTADGHVGGLVGQNYIGGAISDSNSTAAARGTDTYVGGLVGYNWRRYQYELQQRHRDRGLSCRWCGRLQRWEYHGKLQQRRG